MDKIYQYRNIAVHQYRHIHVAKRDQLSPYAGGYPA